MKECVITQVNLRERNKRINYDGLHEIPGECLLNAHIHVEFTFIFEDDEYHIDQLEANPDEIEDFEWYAIMNKVEQQITHALKEQLDNLNQHIQQENMKQELHVEIIDTQKKNNEQYEVHFLYNKQHEGMLYIAHRDGFTYLTGVITPVGMNRSDWKKKVFEIIKEDKQYKIRGLFH